MKRHTRQNAIISLIAVLVCLLTAEVLLRTFDPLGGRYFDDLVALANHQARRSARVSYSLAPGNYTLHNWSVTVNDDFTRRLPDTNPVARCKVVIIGDSVAWSLGVSDSQAWANLIAGQIPDVFIRNAAYPGYNSEDVKALAHYYPDADALIYLIVSNDDDASFNSWASDPPPHPNDSMIRKYLLFFAARGKPYPKDRPRFEQDIADIAADRRVTLAAFDDAWGQALVEEGWSVALIPHYTHPNSFIDGHANPEGNKQIAESMLPIVRRAAQKCIY